MNRSMLVVALAACGIVMLAGCGGSAASSSAPEQLKPEEEMRRFELDFRPSDYDPDPTGGVPAERVTVPAPDSAAVDPYATMTEEMAPGFRVQIYSSTSIDQATARMAEAETLVPNEWFYLEFDPPVYKIRAGNFLTKYEADRFARQMTEKGFVDSWSVPTRVFTSPPPPPIRTPPAPPK